MSAYRTSAAPAAVPQYRHGLRMRMKRAWQRRACRWARQREAALRGLVAVVEAAQEPDDVSGDRWASIVVDVLGEIFSGLDEE